MYSLLFLLYIWFGASWAWLKAKTVRMVVFSILRNSHRLSVGNWPTPGKLNYITHCVYQNTGDQDVEMTTSLHFPKRKIKKWIKYKRFFDGTVNGNRSFIIPAFETVTVIYVIQAEYTGASLPDKFPMPDEFISMLRFLKWL